MARYNNLHSERVIDAIQEYIDVNGLQADEALPSERKLSELWQVSRGTVRNAITRMSREGALYTVHGKGSFVAAEKEHIDMKDMISFSEAVRSQGKIPVSKLVDRTIEKADKHLAEVLHIKEGEEVHVLTRVRGIDQRKILLEVSHIPLSKCPGLERFRFDKASLYQLLGIHYGIYMSYQDISVRLSKASKEEAHHLEIEVGAPVFVEKGIAYSGQENEVIEYTKTIVDARSANYSICVEAENGRL